jgi:hypothetical protein
MSFEAFVECQLTALLKMSPETLQQGGELLVMGFPGDADVFEQGWSPAVVNDPKLPRRALCV